MRLPVFTVLILLSTNGVAQEQTFDPNEKYHPDSLKRWTTSVMKAISEKHPGFYWYTSKQTFDTLIDSTLQTIQDSLTELDYYRKVKPLFAQIGCIHTGISLSKEYQDHLDKSSTFIPIEIFIDADRKVLLTKEHDPNHVLPMGSEILSINGQPISGILNTLLKSIPSDGFN